MYSDVWSGYPVHPFSPIFDPLKKKRSEVVEEEWLCKRGRELELKRKSNELGECQVYRGGYGIEPSRRNCGVTRCEAMRSDALGLYGSV